MLYGVIAEDTYILRAVPVLLSRLVNVGNDVPECRVWNGKADFVANFWRSVKEFQFWYPDMHKVIAVCDADTERPEEVEARLQATVQSKLPTLPFPLMFHVIKRELETWWVTDPNSVLAVTGVQIPFPGGNIEESVQHAKEHITRSLSTRKITYTREIAEETTRTLNFEVVAARCPGFVVFGHKVENGTSETRSRAERERDQ